MGRSNLVSMPRQAERSAFGVPPIEAAGLTKAYRGRPAVDGIDLLVGAGAIYGFLGPNGAGKTTTMRMLLGLVRPDSGTIRLFGRDPQSDRLAARAGIQLRYDEAAGGERRRHKVLQAVLVPLAHRLLRYRTMHYELVR